MDLQTIGAQSGFGEAGAEATRMHSWSRAVPTLQGKDLALCARPLM